MLYILLAAFNEEKNLPFIFEDIQKQAFTFPYKIILVNDGSTDSTSRTAKEYQKTLPVTILDHAVNCGLGSSLLDGFKFINTTLGQDDTAVVLDADNTHPIELIKDMKNKIDEGFDITIASRFTAGGTQEGLSFSRNILSRCASIFLKIVWPINGVNDYSCGYRMYKGSLLKALFQRYGEDIILEKGFSSSLEILLKASGLTGKICEVPLNLDYSKKQGKSKMKVFKTIFRYFVLIFSVERRA
ncbi:MAG: glycosyltransferase [Elusimicrobia bacterium]|nr:glycosyltransferase [Candidatus Liberimonas magnetica]